MIGRAGLAALHLLDPERAHDLAIWALKEGLTPEIETPTSPRLRTEIAGLALPNPVGLAAGLDKNAVAITPLLKSGFGFIEVGGATPRPQPGNPKPRLFRLKEHSAIINRFGFNSEGAEAVAARLAEPRCLGIVGINLGANKESADKAADFAEVLRLTGPHVDFATINVSSPNTAQLRDLQGKAALRATLECVQDANAGLLRPVPLFLKVAPDLVAGEIDDIAAVALETGIDGLLATNTTLDRTLVSGPCAGEAGGLSGAPLFDRSTRVLAAFARRLEGRVPLVGIGGIRSASDAYAKIRAGASAVQLYTGLVYEGLGLAAEIAEGLDAILIAEGHTRLADAVGGSLSDIPAP